MRSTCVSFVVSVVLLLGLRSRGRVQEEGTPGLSSIVEGLGYAWSRKDLLGTYAVDTLAMLLAFPYAVFPFVAERYDAPWALGLLYAAPAVGDAIASRDERMDVARASSWTRDRRRGIVVRTRDRMLRTVADVVARACSSSPCRVRSTW